MKMKERELRDEKLQDTLREINNFGLSISPKRLSILISNCKADRLPLCITGSHCHLLIAIDVKHFEDEVMNVLDEGKGATSC